MPLSLRVVLFAVVTGATVASCSLFTDLSGFSGGSVTPEASAPEASTADAAADGSATSDAGDGGRFCTGVVGSPAFCEDFDDPTLATAWVPKVDDGGTTRLDDASAASPPNAFRAQLFPVPSGGPCLYAFASHSLAAAFTKSVRVESDVRLGHVGDNGGFPSSGFAANGTTVRGSAANSVCYYYFSVGPSSTSFVVEPDVDGTKTATYPMSRSFAPGRWTHVAVVIDTPANTAPTVTVSLDGVTALDKQPITPTLCGFGTLSAVSPGLFCVSGNATDVETRTDNVAVWTN